MMRMIRRVILLAIVLCAVVWSIGQILGEGGDGFSWVWAKGAPTTGVGPFILMVLGFLLVLTSFGWSTSRHMVTWVHEAGHATMAFLLGRKVVGIKVFARSGGVTIHSGEGGRLSAVLTSISGYPAPALVGMLLALGASQGYLNAVVVLCATVAVLLLPMQRSVISLAITVLFIGMLVLLLKAPSAVVVAIMLPISGALLAASPRTLIDLRRVRKAARETGETQHSDADDLARMTFIPAMIWEVVFALISGATILFASQAVLGYPVGIVS